MKPPRTPTLEDEDAESVRLEHERKIVELQEQPGVAIAVIKDVELPDGTPLSIPHKQGRLVTHMVSSVRGATSTGRIVESRDASAPDRTKYITLTATGWGAAITVDLWVT
jgi:hypothetical protein